MRDLNRMKQNMTNDQYVKSNFLENLGLPKFDKNEHISDDENLSDEEVYFHDI